MSLFACACAVDSSIALPCHVLLHSQRYITQRTSRQPASTSFTWYVAGKCLVHVLNSSWPCEAVSYDVTADLSQRIIGCALQAVLGVAYLAIAVIIDYAIASPRIRQMLNRRGDSWLPPCHLLVIAMDHFLHFYGALASGRKSCGVVVDNRGRA